MQLTKETLSKQTLGYSLLSRGTLSNSGLFGPKYGIGGIDQYTKLMLHMNGDNGSTVFTDSSLTPKTVTANGNVQISTAQSKFGGASGYYDGSGDYLNIADTEDFNFGTGDFTIDFWIKRNNAGTEQWIFTQQDLTVGSIRLNLESSNVVYGGIASSGLTYTNCQSSTTLTDTTTFHHIAFVKWNGEIAISIDGVFGTWVSANFAPANLSLNYFIGYDNRNSKYLNAYIDEFRISKGIARWTTNFTPPNEEYTT